MPSVWDHQADKHLLLSIIETGDLKSIAWTEIQQVMASKGYNFSHEACRQHYQKIRRAAKDGTGSVEVQSSTPKSASKVKSTSTPRKRTPKAKELSTPGSKRKQSAFAPAGNGEENDDEETFDTPSIKRKKFSLKKEGDSEGPSATLLKLEDSDEKQLLLAANDDEIYDEEESN